MIFEQKVYCHSVLEYGIKRVSYFPFRHLIIQSNLENSY